MEQVTTNRGREMENDNLIKEEAQVGSKGDEAARRRSSREQR